MTSSRVLWALSAASGVCLAAACADEDDSAPRGMFPQDGGLIVLDGTAAGAGGGSSVVCVPGHMDSCTGPEDCRGTRICDDDGSGYGACQCAGGGSGGAGGTGGTGGLLITGGTGGLGGCGPSEFQCLSGECIPDFYYCDGIIYCLDGSDEFYCGTGGTGGVGGCGPGQFQCLSGECVSVDYYCDGIVDCIDASDELNCGTGGTGGVLITGGTGGVLITGGTGGAGGCGPGQFQCLSGECIPAEYYCDGIVDCIDASDELNCGTGGAAGAGGAPNDCAGCVNTSCAQEYSNCFGNCASEWNCTQTCVFDVIAMYGYATVADADGCASMCAVTGIPSVEFNALYACVISDYDCSYYCFGIGAGGAGR